MATIPGGAADFLVINDALISLKPGADIDTTQEFQLPSETTLATSPPLNGILTWNVRAESASGAVTYEIRVNGHLQTTQPVSGTDWRTVQEAFNTNILTLKPGINKVEFRVTGGSIGLTISDVALWFRKEVIDPIF